MVGVPRPVVLAAVLLTACARGEEPAAEAPQGVEFPPELAEPQLLSYHPDLEVDITAMRRRASGLWLQDLEPGEGDTVKAGALVSINYTGWLHDGTLVETNADRVPFSFRVGIGDMLAGWDEGIVGMRAGGKRKLILPYQLGFGEMGEGEIPPFAVLVYEIELVGFTP